MALRPIPVRPWHRGRTAKRLLLGILMLVGVIVISAITLTRIDAAHVGIRVKLAEAPVECRTSRW